MSAGDAPEEAPDTLAFVLVTAGGWRIGLEAHRVAGLHPAPAEGDGDDIESLLGLPPAAGTAATAQTLHLRRPRRDIRVCGPVELVRLPLSCIHPLPPLLAARTRLRGLCALALREENGKDALVFLLDPDRLPLS